MATKRKTKAPAKRVRSKTIRPAAWFHTYGRGDESPERSRAYRLATLVARVKLLRPYFSGFEAADGFDLRHPERWKKSQVDAVDDYSSTVNTLRASPHIDAPARTKRQRKALEKFTGQVYRGKKKPKKFIVHHPEAETKGKRKVRARVTKDNRVEIVREVSGVKTRMTSYLFEDFGVDPAEFVSVDDLIRATKKMIRAKNGMPPGWYQLETMLHGPIWYAMERDDIVLNLQRFGQQYTRSPEFSKGILGFRRFRDEIDAEIQTIEQQRIRRERAKFRLRFAASNRMRSKMNRWRERAAIEKRKTARKPARRKK